MAEHEYTPRQALDEILKRLREKAPELAAEAELNINLGQEVEGAASPRQRSQEPDYERRIPLTTREAIQAVLDTLQAHFVEQPLFMISADQNFAASAEGVSEALPEFVRGSAGTVSHGRDVLKLTRVGEPKALAFEVQPETRVVGTDEEIFLVKPITKDQIDLRSETLKTLRKLTDFNG